MLDSVRLSISGNVPEATGFLANLSEFSSHSIPTFDRDTGQHGEPLEYYDQNKRADFGAYLRYMQNLDQWTIEFDAKTLWTAYPEGIHDGTLEAVLRRIERTNSVEFIRPEIFLNRAQVGRADIAANIEPSAGLPATLAACRQALRWNRKLTDYRFSESLLLYNTREEFNFYDKHTELRAKAQTPTGREFFKKVGPLVENRLRIEYRAKRPEVVAKKFYRDYEVFTRPTVLKNRIVYLEEIMARSKQKKALLESFASMQVARSPEFGTLQSILESNLPLVKIRAACGSKWILDQCGSEEQLVSLLKAKCGRNWRSAKKRLMEEAQIAAGLAGREAIEIIQDIQERLEAA